MVNKSIRVRKDQMKVLLIMQMAPQMAIPAATVSTIIQVQPEPVRQVPVVVQAASTAPANPQAQVQQRSRKVFLFG